MLVGLAEAREKIVLFELLVVVFNELADELGRLLSREEGKTLPEGIGEVARAGNIFKFFAGEALRLSGEKLPSVRPGVEVEITREPLPKRWVELIHCLDERERLRGRPVGGAPAATEQRYKRCP